MLLHPTGLNTRANFHSWFIASFILSQILLLHGMEKNQWALTCHHVQSLVIQRPVTCQHHKWFSFFLFQGGHIIFFQSLSLLGYCLFPLVIGALVCMLKDNVIIKVIVVSVALAWSSWAAYPFMSSAVNPRRKALALYPVFLMYVSVGFLIIAID